MPASRHHSSQCFPGWATPAWWRTPRRARRRSAGSSRTWAEPGLTGLNDDASADADDPVVSVRRLVHVQRRFGAVPRGQRRTRRSGPVRVDTARAGLGGDPERARDADVGLAEPSVEAAVARAPARALTDEHDTAAAGDAVRIDRVRCPGLVPRRPDEQQGPVGVMVHHALVAWMRRGARAARRRTTCWRATGAAPRRRR